jgi:hypothetical protein
MWKALFEAIAAGFGFFGTLLAKKPATTTEEPIDAAAARAGAAAGAAANAASKQAGKEKSK